MARSATSTIRALIKMNSAKIYFTVVTLSINNNIKFLEHLKRGWKKKQYLGINLDLKYKHNQKTAI